MLTSTSSKCVPAWFPSSRARLFPLSPCARSPAGRGSSDSASRCARPPTQVVGAAHEPTEVEFVGPYQEPGVPTVRKALYLTNSDVMKRASDAHMANTAQLTVALMDSDARAAGTLALHTSCVDGEYLMRVRVEMHDGTEAEGEIASEALCKQLYDPRVWPLQDGGTARAGERALHDDADAGGEWNVCGTIFVYGSRTYKRLTDPKGNTRDVLLMGFCMLSVVSMEVGTMPDGVGVDPSSCVMVQFEVPLSDGGGTPTSATTRTSRGARASCPTTAACACRCRSA